MRTHKAKPCAKVSSVNFAAIRLAGILINTDAGTSANWTLHFVEKSRSIAALRFTETHLSFEAGTIQKSITVWSWPREHSASSNSSSCFALKMYYVTRNQQRFSTLFLLARRRLESHTSSCLYRTEEAKRNHVRCTLEALAQKLVPCNCRTDHKE